MSQVKKRFHSWIYLLVYVMGTFIQISILKLLIAINISNTRHLIQSTLRNLSFITRLYVQVGFANLNKNLKATKETWDHGLLKGHTQRKLLIRKCRRSSLIFLRKLILRKRCFLVVTYHPNLNCLSKIIRDNLYLLYMKLKRSFLWNLWYLWEAQGN